MGFQLSCKSLLLRSLFQESRRIIKKKKTPHELTQRVVGVKDETKGIPEMLARTAARASRFPSTSRFTLQIWEQRWQSEQTESSIFISGRVEQPPRWRHLLSGFAPRWRRRLSPAVFPATLQTVETYRSAGKRFPGTGVRASKDFICLYFKICFCSFFPSEPRHYLNSISARMHAVHTFSNPSRDATGLRTGRV